jgi:hypothetical protein
VWDRSQGENVEACELRSEGRSWFRRFTDIVMMAAALAFAFQATFIAQTASGANSHYHPSLHRHAKTHVIAHVHADGTVHQHAVEDGARALSDHLQEPGCPCCWNMAIVAGMLPLPIIAKFDAVASTKLTVEDPDPYRGTEPDGPRRPPRTPSIA